MPGGGQLAKLNSPLVIWPATVALAVLLYFGLGYLESQAAARTVNDTFRKAWLADHEGAKAADVPTWYDAERYLPYRDLLFVAGFATVVGAVAHWTPAGAVALAGAGLMFAGWLMSK